MEFIDVFGTEKPKQVLKEYCSRSKPGADKVNFKQFQKDFDQTILAVKTRIACRKYKFTRFEPALKVKRHYTLPRLIFKCSIRDRLVSKLMADYLQDYYQSLPDQNGPLVKTRSNVLDQIYEALHAQDTSGRDKFCYFLRLDIHSYFDSINRSQLMTQLERDGLDDGFLHLIQKLFWTMDLSMDRPSGFGVPQGISVSSVLAERYLRDFDRKYYGALYQQDMFYVRYVDDIFVLTTSEEKLRYFSRKLQFELSSQYGLLVNPEKVCQGNLDETSVDYLGVTISKRTIGISTSQAIRVKRQVEELFLWYRRVFRTRNHPLHGNSSRALDALTERLNLLITGYLYQKKGADGQLCTRRYGWILTSLPRQTDNVEELRKLDRHVGALIRAYIQDTVAQQRILARRKSFYAVYQRNRFHNNRSGYILDRERIAQNLQEMYRITCNLSLVDLKHHLGPTYDPAAFQAATGMELRPYFNNTLYIANRNLTSEILYW